MINYFHKKLIQKMKFFITNVYISHRQNQNIQDKKIYFLIRKTIILSPETRIDESLKIYLLTIGKYEHINKQIFNFYYGSYHLKFGDYKTIEDVFKNILTQKIIVK